VEAYTDTLAEMQEKKILFQKPARHHEDKAGKSYGLEIRSQ